MFRRFNASLNCPNALNGDPTAAAYLSPASNHILNHSSRKQIHLILGIWVVYFFLKMSKAWTQIFLYPPHREMSICAIDTMLLTDGEDSIAKHPKTINASIKQCVAFQGLQFICFIFFSKVISFKRMNNNFGRCFAQGKRELTYTLNL